MVTVTFTSPPLLSSTDSLSPKSRIKKKNRVKKCPEKKEEKEGQANGPEELGEDGQC